MGFYDGPSIVTNGLVLSLDAADNNSYPGSGAVWRDLTSTIYSGSLINSPTYNVSNGGSIVFNGSTQYATASMNCDKTNYSVDWWIYPTTTANFNQFISFNRYGWNGFACHTTSTGQIYVGTTAIDNTGRIIPWRTGVYITNTWQNITWTFANGAAKFYKNSVLETSATLSVSADASFTSISIGTATASDTINGRIASIKVYSNKVLSADEILQNYNAQKSRFGL